MRNKSSIAFAAALCLATAATPLLASAQSVAPPAPGAQQQAPRERPSRIEGRIAFLKTELKITDAQTAQWNTVADAMRKNDAAMRDLMRQARGEHRQGSAPNALDALAQRERFAEVRAEGARQFAAAFRPLYASLSDEQKRTADELLGRHGGPRHHGGWRH